MLRDRTRQAPLIEVKPAPDAGFICHSGQHHQVRAARQATALVVRALAATRQSAQGSNASQMHTTLESRA
jgi:hypothetical protein